MVRYNGRIAMCETMWLRYIRMWGCDTCEYAGSLVGAVLVEEIVFEMVGEWWYAATGAL